MKTVIIQLGNTDNKLTQKEWAIFISNIEKVLSDTKYTGLQVHFAGGSSAEKAWQNYCFVFNCYESDIESIRFRVQNIRGLFKQDSVAFTLGKTELI